jgi:hypothetical protein
MLNDGINNFDSDAPSIDPPDNGGPGLAGLSSAMEEVLGDSGAEEAIDPPDNGLAG